MVRAILAGTKTQTRRIAKYTAALGDPEDWTPGEDPLRFGGVDACPYGQPGDRLWVRETWQAIRAWDDGEVEEVHPVPKGRRGGIAVVYSASDEQAGWHRDDRGFSWRSPIFMPRWASRITLEVTGVRVQRLQDISEDDAKAEGLTGHDPDPADQGGTIYAWHGLSSAPCPLAHFRCLWEQIHGVDSWSANPWVWVIEFSPIKEFPR